MKTDLKYNHIAPQLLETLPQGAFLSVKAGDRINTMTIGWGSIGFIWNTPIIMVAVRPSRYTYDLIEQSLDFTVSVSSDQSFKDALALAGTKSGRDMDKFAAANITAEPGKTVDSPVVNSCGLIIEGKIVFKQAMNPEYLDASIQGKYYPDGDFHTLYFGEITAFYHNK